jgi:protein-S-isoprenylcysteine O-methyltransferase Ste14
VDAVTQGFDPRALALGAGVIGAIFVVVPMGLVALNEALEWPRWHSGIGAALGGVLVLTGIAVAAYCTRLFRRIGQGTPVPISPPTRLVISGLYRYSRNPIYIADVMILLGLFLHRGELTLLLYVIAFALAAHAVVVWREEPELLARFGTAYRRYMEAVPRWIGPRRGSHP